MHHPSPPARAIRNNPSPTTTTPRGGAYRPTSPLFLLLGKRERIPSVATQENWRDLECRWVAINNSTGLVTSSTNAVGASLPEVRRNAQLAQGTQ